MTSVDTGKDKPLQPTENPDFPELIHVLRLPTLRDEKSGPTRRYPMELSVVMPCLNEADTVGVCILKAQAAIHELNIDGEIVIADNGSTDGSQEIARELGVRVVNVTE
ncbi:MAG: glycosyltransferase family 2 protein, partial [Planctomyces sp.]